MGRCGGYLRLLPKGCAPDGGGACRPGRPVLLHLQRLRLRRPERRRASAGRDRPARAAARRPRNRPDDGGDLRAAQSAVRERGSGGVPWPDAPDTPRPDRRATRPVRPVYLLAAPGGAGRRHPRPGRAGDADAVYRRAGPGGVESAPAGAGRGGPVQRRRPADYAGSGAGFLRARERADRRQPCVCPGGVPPGARRGAVDGTAALDTARGPGRRVQQRQSPAGRADLPPP